MKIEIWEQKFVSLLEGKKMRNFVGEWEGRVWLFEVCKHFSF